MTSSADSAWSLVCSDSDSAGSGSATTSSSDGSSGGLSNILRNLKMVRVEVTGCNVNHYDLENKIVKQEQHSTLAQVMQ